MNASLRQRIEIKVERFQELQQLLGDPAIIGDQKQFRELSREFSALEPLAVDYQAYQASSLDLTEAQTLCNDKDPDISALGWEELPILKARLAALEQNMVNAMLPVDPDDHKDVLLEVRAGTGGDEAALFAGVLLRMYGLYCTQRGWKLSILSASEGDAGGYKEVICTVSGEQVYGHLKFESGAHRVQRVPSTESQGRIHTSACTVAVMPQADELEDIQINPADLRVDTFRASGAGGQHVNRTDSAIRITHLPSGMVVECQEERSQHKNRAKAMSVLASRLADQQRSQADAAISSQRKALVGSGDRSERIRTYNYPQGRVTDHRINLTLYKLDEVLQGDLDDLIGPLKGQYQALLAEEAGAL